MAAKETAEVVTEAIEVFEEATDILEDRVSWVVSNPKATAVIAGISGLVLGGVLGYRFASKKLRSFYQAQSDQEVEEMREYYASRDLPGQSDKPDLEELARAYAQGDEPVFDATGVPDESWSEDEMLEYYRNIVRQAEESGKLVAIPQEYADILNTEAEDKAAHEREQAALREVAANERVAQIRVEPVIPDRRPQQRGQRPPRQSSNIFDGVTEFDFEEETQFRKANPDKPHIISKVEFEENESGYDQETLLYYAEDDVLCEGQMPLANPSLFVGESKALARFGYGSEDPHVVFVSVPELTTDYEIVMDPGSYVDSIAGLGETAPEPRKFKRSDR